MTDDGFEWNNICSETNELYADISSNKNDKENVTFGKRSWL